MTSVSDEQPLQTEHEGAPDSHRAAHEYITSPSKSTVHPHINHRTTTNVIIINLIPLSRITWYTFVTYNICGMPKLKLKKNKVKILAV